MKTAKEILEKLLLAQNKEWDLSSIKTDEQNRGICRVAIPF
jgi:hypothetical protein